MSQIVLSMNGGEQFRFDQTNLEFGEINIRNVFSLVETGTLADTLKKQRYKKLAREVRDEYKRYMRYPLAEFLREMKDNGNPFYRQFLNDHGEDSFCKFFLTDGWYYDKKGLYLYCLDNVIMYVGITEDNFKKRINMGYGNISPYNTLLNGQKTNCHLNSLINEVDHGRLSLWICVFDDISNLRQVEKHFIGALRPFWNIALKPMSKSNCLNFTHCSESKYPDFKNSLDSTTPDVLYTSDRIKSFFDCVKEKDVPWAVFSDKYGFVFPATKIQWYDLSPDAVTDADIERFVDEAFEELSKYEKIIYRTGGKHIHRTYQELIDAIRSRGLVVAIETR